jgi:hypothetical protein
VSRAKRHSHEPAVTTQLAPNTGTTSLDVGLNAGNSDQSPYHREQWLETVCLRANEARSKSASHEGQTHSGTSSK